MRTIQPGDETALPTVRLAGKSVLPAIRLAAILGLLATAVLLGVVSATAGLGVAGWIAGLVTGSVAAALLVTARMRSDQPAVHPADWVTLTRAVLIAGVAGLVADSFSGPVSVPALVTLSAVALVLDAADGQVARRTGTATALGGRLDGEADAFLILLLSIYVSQDYGSWVLLIGAARYALLVAGWLIPWLAAPLPPRFWGKVVAAVAGIVLTVAASGLAGRLAGMIAVAAALLLLAESFGRNIIWLYRTGAGPRTRRALRWVITVGSVVLVWGVLVAPDRIFQLTPGAFARIPVELLVLVAVAVLLPPWPRRIVAAVAGILFGLLTPGHKPVMAEIDTVSSHTPWAPLPAMVPWDKVGDGSIFDPMPARSQSPITVWRNDSTVRQFFGRSLQYSLETLTSWVTELHDPNLVLILLGDEQPGGPITRPRASHEVPISIVAHDPSVFKQIAPWHWQDGLIPGHSAPRELMNAFRNQFLGAFSTPSSQVASAYGPAAPEPPR